MKKLNKANVLKSIQRGIQDAERKLSYAKNFTPHKVGYYEEMLKAAKADYWKVQSTPTSKLVE